MEQKHIDKYDSQSSDTERQRKKETLEQDKNNPSGRFITELIKIGTAASVLTLASCAGNKPYEATKSEDKTKPQNTDIIHYKGGSGFPTDAFVNYIRPKYGRANTSSIGETEKNAFSIEDFFQKEFRRFERRELKSIVNRYRAFDPDSEVIYPRADVAMIIDRSKRGIVFLYRDGKSGKLQWNKPTIKRIRSKDDSSKTEKITMSTDLRSVSINWEILDKMVQTKSEREFDIKVELGAFANINSSGKIKTAAGILCEIQF